MDSLGGASIGLVLQIGGSVFNDRSILSFNYENTLNSCPSGRLSVLVPDPSKFVLQSGTYGLMMFINSGEPSLGNTEFKIYINNMYQETLTEHNTIVHVSWKLGSPLSMSQDTYAVRSDSAVGALATILKKYSQRYDNLVTGDLDRSVDTMTWRVVTSDMEDAMHDIVEHSNIPGDYLFWAFDETKARFSISSFKYAKTKAPVNCCVWSKDALNSTGVGTYKDADTGVKLWQYWYERRGNTLGDARGDIFPQKVYSDVSDGETKVSKCSGDCFNGIAQNMGAMPADVMKESFGISDNDNPTYGELEVEEAFPRNVHPFYHGSVSMRKRIIGEYSKMLVVGMFNEIGPSVGTAMAVYTLLPNHDAGDNLPDPTYVDTYIVARKRVTKDTGTTGGLLNVEKSDNTPNYVTYLTLISNNTMGQEFESTVQHVANILDSYNKMDKG